jgi:hypothetical protein
MRRTYPPLPGWGLIRVLGLLGASGLALWPLTSGAGVFGRQPLVEDATVALAQPLDNGQWKLILVERLQPGAAGCWSRQSDGSVLLAPQIGGVRASGAQLSESQLIGSEAGAGDSRCSRLQSSSGYSLRAADGELPSPWRLRIAAGAAGLELQALNPSLKKPLTVALAPMPPAAGEGLVSFRLEPGWSFQGRTHAGRRLSHIYLASAEPLALLQARARGGDIQSLAGLPPPPPPLELAQRERRRPDGWRRPQQISRASIEPAPGQVISLPVLPFQETAALPATSP